MMRKLLAAWLACCALSNLFFLLPIVGLHGTAVAEDGAYAAQTIDEGRYAEVATTKGTLNMRAEPKENAKILTKLPRGTIVRIVEDLGEWTQILYGERAGYVMTSFLAEIVELPYSLITADSDGEAVLAFKRALYKLEYLKSEEINQRFDAAMETALTKLQLMNGVALNPQAVTPQLQALMEWGMIEKGKSGYFMTATDRDSDLSAAIFCWDSGGILYEDDRAVKLSVSFAAQASGGQPPYTITVRKSLSGQGGEQHGDVVTSPFSHIWGQDSDYIYLYATVDDAAGNTLTVCTPFRYVLPARYQSE